MSLLRLNTRPSDRDLRVFATLWLVFFGFAALWASRRGADALALRLGVTAAVVGVMGWIRPGAVRLVYLGATCAAWPVGWVVSHVIMAVLYYLVITPVGLVMRLCGRDPLQRRFDPAAKSYWRPRGPRPPPESYFNQW